MDKNKNKILIGCLALLLVMTVGYALFSENITINGTATAQGDFDISFTCDMVTKDNYSQGEEYTKGGTGNCSIDGQTITTTSTLTKPTDQVVYKVTLTNDGSIPAILKTIDSPNNFDGNGDTFPDAYFDITNVLIAGYVIKGYYDNDTEVENAKITLQPGESQVMLIYHGWWEADPQPELPEEGATINYNVTLGFEQVQAQ